MAWGENGTGENLVLDYKAMCNSTCKCNNQLGYCMNIKKIDYRENRCKNACDQWFGAGTTNAALCKGYCYLLGDAQPYWDQLPKSKADYLNRFVTDANPKVYYKSPIVGQIPGSSQSWGDWRDSVFKANTVDCKGAPGGGIVWSKGGESNVLGQTTGSNFKDEEATCNKFTGYFSKYLGGKLKDTLVPLSLRELYSYSNPYRPPLIQSFSTAKQFCETLMYANGQIVPEADRPYCCGGNGPNFSPYDPFTKVLNEMQPEINATKKAIEKKISDTAKIIKAVWVIAVVIVLIMLLLRFF
jgi:hypothetical protein